LKIPNSKNAVIEKEKLVVYLLNPKHKRGGTKARLLNHFGRESIDDQNSLAD
jgi:hypothetical protein